MVIESVNNVAPASYQKTAEAPELKADSTPKSVEVQSDAVAAAGGVTENGAQSQQAKGDPAAQQNSSNTQIRKAVEEINKKANNSEAIFGVHEKTNRVTIKIVDKDTKETIREFPPEKTLDMIAKVWEMAGLMVDEKR